MANAGTASLTIAELREFASFSPSEQRYIKRSLDVGLGRQDAFKLWARDASENASIRSQYVVYQELKRLRGAVPADSAFDALESFMGKLIRLAAFDLAQERIDGFSAFRFLYERLLGPEARPFLPSAFCAAFIPNGSRRKRRDLMVRQSRPRSACNTGRPRFRNSISTIVRHSPLQAAPGKRE
jgi:hypothetical protein